MKSKYFPDNQLACRCGCGLMPKDETIALADKIREEWGGPLLCISGARCDAYTRELQSRGIPAATHSAHNVGWAVDLSPITRPGAAPENGNMKVFHTFCQGRLVAWDAWMESPQYTTTWAHIQLRPASKRVFDPQ